jgi:CHAT domain-containing protein/tetratricopeptide (TPR) repeat protein
MQLQAIFFSDTMLMLNQKVVKQLKETVGTNDTRYAGSLVAIAMIYMLKGEYQKSLPLLQQSEEIFKGAKKENDVVYPIILNNLGILFEKMGQYDKAMSYYKLGLDIRRKIYKEEHVHYPLLVPISLTNVASLYMMLKDYEKARQLFEEAVEIRRRLLGEENPYYVISLNSLASLYSTMGNYQEALPIFKQALAVYEKAFGTDDLEYILALENLALLNKTLGNYEPALTSFQQILAWRKKTLGEDNPSYASTLKNLGLLYQLSGHSNEASSCFIKADKISIKQLSRTYSSLAEMEKLIFLKQELPEFYYLPSLVFTQNIDQPEIVNQVYANEIALKGMVLEDQRQVLYSIRQSGDSSTLRLYRQWQYNKALTGRQMLLPKSQRDPKTDSIAATALRAEEELSRRSTAFRKQQQIENIGVKNVSQQLVQGQAVIEYCRFKIYNKRWTDSIMYGALIVLPGDSNARFVPLFEEKKLANLLAPSANTKTPVTVLYPSKILAGKKGTASMALYNMIWKPLEKYLNNVQTVYYAPTGLLHRIAFQALHPNANHLLIDSYQLNELLSTRSVAFPQNLKEKPASASLWGDIEYDLQNTTYTPEATTEKTDTSASFFNLYNWDTRGNRGKAWNALPGTKKEIDSIGSILQNSGLQLTKYSGLGASEVEFKAMDSKSKNIIHIATHGYFLPIKEPEARNEYSIEINKNSFTVQQNPLFRSGLILAGANHSWMGKAAIPGMEDGILTAYEIAQLDLSGTTLIVLSACESGLGDLQDDNEGVIGLQRAFKIAGVKQMLVTLWAIPDKETSEIMTIFYRNWLGGQTTRQALRNAQLNMKKKYSPFYWAGFVLVE